MLDYRDLNLNLAKIFLRLCMLKYGAILAAVFLFIGITVGYALENLMLQSQINSLSSDLAEAQRTIKNYEEEIADLRSQISSLESNKSLLEERIKVLIERLNETSRYVIQLKADYESLLSSVKNQTLKNPTWDDLKSFLEQDDTDKLEYKPGEFDCTGFAIRLRDNAWRLGYRCAFVEIALEEGMGHALNAFQTADGKIIFVDDVESDAIAYVEVSQPYGRIELNAVRLHYIDCSGDPARFWGPLNYTSHPDPFSYDYYLSYRRRVEFYGESVEAYNRALDDYRRGEGNYSYSQLQSWYENLEMLREELGVIYEPMGTVQNIEVYWNQS